MTACLIPSRRESYSKGTDVNLQADPTTAVVLQKQFKERKEALKKERKASILSKYGEQESHKAPDRSLLFGQTDHYLEYTAEGRLVGGGKESIPKTKYEEDVYPQNHTAVWGSWFDKATMQWGYACCHQVRAGPMTVERVPSVRSALQRSTLEPRRSAMDM